MITTSEGLDKIMSADEYLDKIIMKCIDKYIKDVSLYAVKQLLANERRYDIIENTYTISYRDKDTMDLNKCIIGMNIVNFLWINNGCNFSTSYIHPLGENALSKDHYIKITDKVLERLKRDGIIISIGKNYIMLIDSVKIAEKFKEKYGISWKYAYDIIEGKEKKEKSENYIIDYLE
jgi:hypothetical protein